MPIQIPLQVTDLLADYLHVENDAGYSDTGVWHSSPIGTVCLTRHNSSNSSQVQFDGAARSFGYVELANLGGRWICGSGAVLISLWNGNL